MNFYALDCGLKMASRSVVHNYRIHTDRSVCRSTEWGSVSMYAVTTGELRVRVSWRMEGSLDYALNESGTLLMHKGPL